MEKQDTYSCIDIANYFIKKHKNTNNQITNMQLQKLVYFTNGIYMHYEGYPLIKEKIQAWKYGPVIPELYDELKNFGSNAVNKIIQNDNSKEISEEMIPLLESIDRIFGTMDAWELSDISHIKEGAWDKAKKLGDYLENEDIKEEFKKLHIPSLTTDKEV